jgi:hypothetical protein
MESTQDLLVSGSLYVISTLEVGTTIFKVRLNSVPEKSFEARLSDHD